MSNGIRPLTADQVQQILYDCEQPMVNYNKIGRITGEGWWNRYVCPLVTHDVEPRLLQLTRILNASIEGLEKKAVKFFDGANSDPAFRQQAEAYRSRFQPYLQLAKLVEQEIERLQMVDPELKREYDKLKLQEVGFRYRLRECNGGIDPLAEPDPACLAQLIASAQQWKNQEKLAINKELNALEIDQLKKAACYPEWVALLLNNPSYRKNFFGWAIRDYNPVDAFIEYNHARKKIRAALLSSPLGKVRSLNQEMLAIEKIATEVTGVTKKVLTLPVYDCDGDFTVFDPAKQKRINILKPDKEIHFENGSYHLTVDELFELSARRNLEEVNVNLSAWGFVNFHPIHGRWNANTQSYDAPPYKTWTADNWMNHVPPTGLVSQEELERQYGEEVKGRTFFYKAAATRQKPDLTALDCHGFWQLYIAMGNGQWKELNVGVYAYRFQRGLLDGLMMFCDTVVRVLCLLDQNGAYTHRQLATYPVFPTEEESKQVLQRIFAIMTTSGVFQFAGRNCAYRVQRIGEKCVQNLPNLFRMPITRVKSGFAPLDIILAWADRQAQWLKWVVVTLIHNLFQSNRGLYITRLRERNGQQVQEEVRYSVNDYLNERHEIHNPAYLAHQIAQAKAGENSPFVKGELSWGHTDRRMACAAQGLSASSTSGSLPGPLQVGDIPIPNLVTS
ncbi:hypothetical protein [Candidatus Protochlamydia phocaeensis]|uniref:hypothetical protein n=1 Tax=Candidatus Protochlamydia phocaeensis TaxID=1414722 RepID=UPI00083848BA|nr:hypothetical protein [Candidatus Protochlamydia phocaeensis]